MRKSLIWFGVIGIVTVGCQPRKLDPSEDPRSAISDPSKISPVTPEMQRRSDQIGMGHLPETVLTDENDLKVTLKQVGNQKPMLLYFIQRDCPCCIQAEPFMLRISKAFGDKIGLVGLINATPAQARDWKRKNEWPGPLICDPKGDTIRKLGAENGTASAIVDAAGQVMKRFPGYSQADLAQITGVLARLCGTPTPPIAFKEAPIKPATGCSF